MHIGLDGTVREARDLPGGNVVGRAIAAHPSGRWMDGGIIMFPPFTPPDAPALEVGGGFVHLGWR